MAEAGDAEQAVALTKNALSIIEQEIKSQEDADGLGEGIEDSADDDA